MRISDWSSDVCSSDLAAFRKHPEWFAYPVRVVLHSKRFKPSVLCTAAYYNVAVVPEQPIVLTTMVLDRTRVVSGKSVSVRVDLGGRRIIKKKKRHKKIEAHVQNQISTKLY